MGTTETAIFIAPRPHP